MDDVYIDVEVVRSTVREATRQALLDLDLRAVITAAVVEQMTNNPPVLRRSLFDAARLAADVEEITRLGAADVSWFKLDDGFHQHPKVMRAGNAATGLWVRCGTWSAAYLTDGFVPTDVTTLYGRPREVELLVEARLWLPVDRGFVMPDYLEYNPTKVDVEQRRKNDAERKRRGRDAQTGARKPRDANGRYVGDDRGLIG